MSSKNFIVKNGISVGENEIVSANGDIFLHGNLKLDGLTIINTSGDLTVPGNLIIGTTTIQPNVNNHANSAFEKANTADQRAVTSGVYANAAYGQANTANTNAATANQRAVTSGVYANSAYGQANTATTNAATADQKAVTSGVYANSAFASANTKSPLAGSSSVTTTGTVTSGTWSASFGAVSGANLTSLTAGNLSGTIPSGVLGNSSLNVGTTSIALNRGSSSLTLTGVSIDGNAATASSVAWGNVSSKPSNIMYYQGFTLDANTMDSNSTGFTYASNAPYTGPVARFSTGGGYDLWLNSPYGGGTNIAFRTRNGDNATLNAWRYPVVYDVNGATGALYGTIFYDSNDTGYYVDPNTTSTAARLRGQIYIGPNTSDRYMRVGGPGGNTDVCTLAASNGNLHIDNQSGYEMYLNYYTNNPTRVYNLRASVMYDMDNTEYYVDPASTSRLNQINPNSIYFQVANPQLNASSYFIAPGGAYFSSGTVYCEAAIQARGGINNDSGAALTLIGGTGGYTNINGSARSPIFYDLEDTAWYCDPNNTSRFRLLTVPSNVGSGTFPVSISSTDRGIIFGNSSGSGIPCYFTVNSGGTVSGSIIASGGTTSYNTSSDYRMKENDVDVDATAALAKIMSLRPVTFDWKREFGGRGGIGFIAHELDLVAPECVSGDKDAVNEDGTINPQSVDTSWLIPSICAAMQKQQELIKQLLAELAALKGN